MSTNLTPSNTNAVFGVESHGRVILVDPNAVNSGPNPQENALPPMEEMTAYVELYCIRRTDTVITLGENGQATLDSVGSVTKVNMLNFDRGTQQNTTLYTDDLVGVDGRINNEGFGIESIDITMGANYNPMVSIMFRDVRGATLFAGGDKSPMAAIFDFPPPLYKLRIKGAYGRFVEYDLHMVDHNGANTDSNGDYTLRCNFVGHYFGPLADMLLGYIKAAPFLRGEGKTVYADDGTTSTVGGEATKVNSFFELVNRGELLYTAVQNYTDQSTKLQETKQITTVNEQVQTIRKVFTTLGEINNPDFAAFMKANKREGWVSKVEVKTRPGENFIFTYSFKRDTVTDISQEDGSISEFVLKNQPPDSQLRVLIKKFITDAIENLQKQHPIIGPETQRPIQMTYKTTKNLKIREVDNAKQDYEYEINYQPLMQALDLIVQGNLDTEKTLKVGMETDLRGLANQTLGLAPTIGNIFEVICKDFDYMMGAIRKAGDGDRPTAGSGTDYAVNGTVAWPYVQVSREIKGLGQAPTGEKPKKQQVLVYPGENPAFRTWPEVQLVEQYCESITEQQKAEQKYDNFQKAIDPNLYVPISPLEFTGEQAIFPNPYMGAPTQSLPALYTELLKRYIVTKDYSYGQVFDVQEELPYAKRSNWFLDTQLFTQEQRRAIVKMQARLEAHNVAYVVQTTENMSAALLQASNVTTAAVMENVRQGNFPFLKLRGKKSDSFPFRDKTVFRRGNVKETRGNSGFNGIIAIVDKPNERYRTMYDLKSTDKADPIDADRELLLQDLAKTYVGNAESRTPKINAANLLIYPDAKATAGSGKSDFIEDGTEFWLFKLKLMRNGAARANYDFYRLIATSALVNTDVEFLGSKYKRAPFRKNTRDAKEDFFGRLDDYEVLVNLYDGMFSGQSDVIAKFLTPGVIEMPRIYAMHLGYQFLGKPREDTNVDKALKLLGITRKKRPNLTFVSQQDRAIFESFYNDADRFDFPALMRDIDAMWRDMRQFVDAQGNLKDTDDVDAFFDEISKKLKGMTSIQKLLEPVYVVNASSMTFLDSEVISPERDGFLTLSDANGELDDPTLEFFLDNFHAELKTMLTETAKVEQKALADAKGKLQDNDFKANVYYNFKSLYDRWVVGTQGYREGELYERFKFVTRSHQNIAQDCIVDFHSLIDDARNEDMSVFTSIGRLLQQNNFMFYPLHSYMEYDGGDGSFDEWTKSWQIDNHLTSANTSKPAFVCMYGGGYSSQAETVSTGSFGDDSFTFQDNPPEDFGSGEGYLYAFRARIGGQNNSIFTFPEWSMEEFKATDVSLKMESQLLDKPSGSEKIRKSQNLMNIYQQRSYNVGMQIPLGNMCIQPTQYFQLEGLPFLGGAYMVHEVSHSISASTHRLETKFKGYRMGRFIHRIMTDYLLSYTGLSGEISTALNEFDSNSANSASSANIANLSGGDSKRLTDQQILELCRAFGYDYNMIKAFIKVESQGGGYDKLGRLKIQFEPHYFKRFTGRVIRNGVEGATAEWKAFNEAAAINLSAAKKSTSWGMGQIMGSNHKAAGHNTVEDMVTAFEQSEFNQLKGMLNFIKADKRLERAIKALDFPNVAKYYNGAGYRKYSYDKKLADAYQYYKSRPMPQPNGNFNFKAGDRTFKVVRQTYSDESTIGGLSLDGEFICYILEDKVRPQGEPVIRGKTAIQAGLYPVDITMSPRMKRETPEITKVPNQRGIRIHEGNTADDSLGCLIVGARKGVDRVEGSRDAYEKLLNLMRQIKARGDGRMYIQIQDSPHA